MSSPKTASVILNKKHIRYYYNLLNKLSNTENTLNFKIEFQYIFTKTSVHRQLSDATHMYDP